jgi:predicted amidohydrolase
LDACLRNLLRWGVDAPAALAAVTATPAAVGGLDDRGRLDPGRLGLVAVLDTEWKVRAAGPAHEVMSSAVLVA